jgi:peptide/nickel transport system ATP-binding protein
VTAPLIAISGLTVDFDTGRRVVRALHGVEFAVAPGEAVGLVGESGSGKSVTWLAALGLLGGRARIGGSVLLDGTELVGAPVRVLEAVRGKRIAMIFQDPASSLNPVHRIGRQIGEALALHRGLSGAAARAETLRLLDRVGIPAASRRLDDYPHQLSGGQNQRVMIAMALAGEPDLLVADEPTTALDATIQARILKLLGELRRDSNMALVLISHALGVVAENGDRVAVMYAGRIAEALGERAAAIRVVRQMGSTEGVKRAVAAGLGVSIVLACAVRDELAAGTLAAVTLSGGSLVRRFYGVLARDVPADAPARRFLTRLAAAGPH